MSGYPVAASVGEILKICNGNILDHRMLREPYSLQSFLPHSLPSSVLQDCKNLEEVNQIHALSLKTAIFHHPLVSSRLVALYSDRRINNLEYARSVFDCIQEPSLVSWNIIIKCYVENHHSHDAILLFHNLLRESTATPDNFTLPCVIKGCAQLRAIEEGKQIHGLILKIGFGSEMYAQSSLVSMYSKCDEVDWAREVFGRMENKDLVSFNSLIDGYAKCGKLELALKLFNEMPEKDSFSWTILVDGYSKCGRVETAREFFDRMPTRNLISWNAMINGYIKSGDFKEAHRLFKQMKTRNIITWNSMIAGYELNGKYIDALKLFQTMLKVGPMPNQATLVSALSAVSGIALLSIGKWIHSYMAKNGFELDGVLGTSLIEMYSKCGSIENAFAVFQEIHRRKLGHWTAIILGLGMHGMSGPVFELFSEMRRVGMKPNAITFMGLLNACNHTGLVDNGYYYFDLMINEYGIEASIEHFGCLVDILCRSGRLEEAKNVIEKMPMRPNKVIWMSLLSGARNYGNVKLAEYAAQHVIEKAPDTIGCYVLLSNIYASVGQWNKVSEIREMMKKGGVRKDPGCSLIEHKGVLHEFLVGDKSHPQSKEIYSKLGEMREKLKCMGHVPDTTQVLLCIEGEKEKEAELEHHSERLAIAFGLINVARGTPIRIVKNLRVCNDCHSVTKLLSAIYGREIIVRDNSRFHHFKDGSCSCMDYW
ncbi:pentatricopeptide repeat-containing protein At1g08070, chloroplastic-like [Malania oleifera]|uniref:pentatricopeptide repeat-containing protein At1g08070, chloroplastic-like n=1 Tax=Malania oleifera TaxID=397392 RepID=UPI0025AEB08C|nr:pentatricopeptide repeat-containing protein At1g08070, chloroplastic-like [Malania oleifera]